MKEVAVQIQTTTNDYNIAKKLISTLLDARVVACVQVQNIESHYHWQGKLVSDKEWLITAKTLKSRALEAISVIKLQHNYSVPEIIQSNIDEVSAEYLSWLIKETKQPIAH